MSTLSSVDKYWCVVHDCLVELHGWSREDATRQCVELRTAVTEPGDEEEESIFYHYEPLYVAHDLAGRDLDEQTIDAAYRAIRARYWPDLYQDVSVARSTLRE